MHIKSILAVAAIAIAATVGSASAADQFTTLDGITAQAMTAQEMGVVEGRLGKLALSLPGFAGQPAAGKANFHAAAALTAQTAKMIQTGHTKVGSGTRAGNSGTTFD